MLPSVLSTCYYVCMVRSRATSALTGVCRGIKERGLAPNEEDENWADGNAPDRVIRTLCFVHTGHRDLNVFPLILCFLNLHGSQAHNGWQVATKCSFVHGEKPGRRTGKDRQPSIIYYYATIRNWRVPTHVDLCAITLPSLSWPRCATIGFPSVSQTGPDRPSSRGQLDAQWERSVDTPSLRRSQDV